jgi:hypothetical protein
MLMSSPTATPCAKPTKMQAATAETMEAAAYRELVARAAYFAWRGASKVRNPQGLTCRLVAT